MNILVATSAFPPMVGGTAAYTFEICRGLLRQHYDITLWTKASVVKGGEVPPGFDVITLIESNWTPGWLRRHRSELSWQEVLTHQKPDLVLIPKLDLFSEEVAVWAHRDGIPFTAIFHGNERLTAKSPILKSKKVFAVSKAVKQRLPEPLSQSAVVVPNGVDTMRFRAGKADAAVLAKLELDKAPRGILNVGSWVPEKGHALLLEAMTHLLPPPEGPELWLVGSGPEERTMRRLADKYRIFDRVRWLGSVDDEQLISVYRTAQFVVLASHSEQFGTLEGFGLPALEAASCGIPAVVSNRGGLPEAVVDGETGIVVSEAKSKAFADAINTLWQDEPRRIAMGKAALDRAMKEFTWEIVLQKLGRELRKIINEARKETERSDAETES
ncbi:MAG: glycosyltransferase family 4 protein [bacterium]|nr:glycosyltransferase family 4 protein [bacterium]